MLPRSKRRLFVCLLLDVLYNLWKLFRRPVAVNRTTISMTEEDHQQEFYHLVGWAIRSLWNKLKHQELNRDIVIKCLRYLRVFKHNQITAPDTTTPFFENYNKGGLIMPSTALKDWSIAVFDIIRSTEHFAINGASTIRETRLALVSSGQVGPLFHRAWVSIIEDADVLKEAADVNVCEWYHTQLLNKVMNAR